MLGRTIRTAACAAAVALTAIGLTGCDVGPVVLEGTLTHPDTGEPLDGVPVRVYSASEETVVARARTGDDGTYQIRAGALGEGTYRVEFSVGHWWQGADTWDTATDVTVSSGSPAQLDAALMPAMTTVWGYTYSRNQPQTGIQVDAFYADTGELAATTISDMCGRPDGPCFELDLPAGQRYTFRTSQDESTTVEWQGYADGVWGIELAPGELQLEVSNLQDAEFSVNGRVVDDDGTPVAGVRVLAVPTDEPVPPILVEDTTADDGTFALGGFDSASQPVSFKLLLVRADGTAALAGMGDDPATATEFVMWFPLLDVLDVGPVDVTPNLHLAGATAVASGGSFTCAVVAGGEVRCWGANFVGQLGDGTTEFNRLTPAAVVTGLSGVIDIASGLLHTCAVVAGGEVRCWGANDSGQLGDGTTENRLTPVTVPGLSGATNIAAGRDHTCALVAAGEVRCWGYNLTGQLGDGTTENRLMPVTVPGLSGATNIAAGRDHTCALVAAGEARCWGDNSFGALGGGNISGTIPTPVAVEGLSGATDIAAGGSHTCAVVAGGEGRCWGATSGDGYVHGPRFQLFAVTGLSSVTDLAAGGSHTCAVVADGEVRCWGDNGLGRLGDGTDWDRSTPVAVVTP